MVGYTINTLSSCGVAGEEEERDPRPRSARPQSATTKQLLAHYKKHTDSPPYAVVSVAEDGTK